MSDYGDEIRFEGSLYLPERIDAERARSVLSSLLDIAADEIYIFDYDDALFLPGANVVALVTLVPFDRGEFPARMDVVFRDETWSLETARSIASMLGLDAVTFDGPEDVPYFVRPNREPVRVDLEPEFAWTDTVTLTSESRRRLRDVVHAA